MVYTEEQTKEISKYNDAGHSIFRLNQHWIMSEHYANSGSLIKWKYRLDSIWRELYPDILKLIKNSGEEGSDVLEKNKLLISNIITSKNNSQLYYNLNARHEFLRSVQDKSGKGNVYVDEDEEGFE